MAENIPYWQKLKDPRWQKKRLEALQRFDFKCSYCDAADKTLHVHHGYYDRHMEPWDYNLETLWPLCEDCHDSAQSIMHDLHAMLATVSPHFLEQLTNQLANMSPKQREILIGRAVEEPPQ